MFGLSIESIQTGRSVLKNEKNYVNNKKRQKNDSECDLHKKG